MNGNFKSSFMKKEIKKKEKDMTAPTYEGGESLLQIRGKMQVEAGISGRVLSGLDPDPWKEMEEGKGKGREGETVTASRRPQLQNGG